MIGTAAGVLLWALVCAALAVGWCLGVRRGRQLQAREDRRKLAAVVHRESVHR